MFAVMRFSLVKQWHHVFPFHLVKYMEAYVTAKDNCV
jgi:hypothetical protein